MTEKTMKEIIENASVFGKLVLCLHTEQEKKQGLIITPSDKNNPIIVDILDVGTEIEYLECIQRQRLMIRPYSGYVLHEEAGKRWLIIREDEILCVIND